MAGNHSFNTEFAKRYGIAEAVIFDNFYYWCLNNKKREINKYQLEGDVERYWTFNSCKALGEIFDYMSVSKIYKSIKKLEKEGLIIIGNFNKTAYDRTSWYAISEKGEEVYKECTSTFVISLYDEPTKKEKKIKENISEPQATKVINEDDFPVDDSSKKEVSEKKSYKKTDYAECKNLVESNRLKLTQKGKSVDKTNYPIQVLNKWLKRLFDTYGVEKTKKGIVNSINNEWLVNVAKYSINALFSDKIFPQCICTEKPNIEMQIKKGQTAFVDKERDYSNDEGAW